MRIQSGLIGQYVPGVGTLADFVPAHFTLPENPIVPGGIGRLADFVDARFTLPENPIMPGLTGLADFVDAQFTLPENPFDGLGDLVDNSGLWPIYMNSVLANARANGMAGLRGHDDCGCGCGGGLSGFCDSASGQFNKDFCNWMAGQWAKIQAGDVATIALWGAGALAVVYLVFGFRGRSYGGAKKEARAKYREEVAKLREQYPTGYQRGRRAAAAF